MALVILFCWPSLPVSPLRATVMTYFTELRNDSFLIDITKPINILNRGTLPVRNSTITDRNASLGAGIMNVVGGTVTVANSTFSGNAAETGGGGGLFNQGTATVTNSTFTGNSGAAGAAAVYNSGG